jgi:hypothetical protein
VFNKKEFHQAGEWRFVMKSDYPFAADSERKDESAVRPSRFIDEKIGDDSGTEATADSALAPAGLNNPFWN